jgi:hypothetical protein
MIVSRHFELVNILTDTLSKKDQLFLFFKDDNEVICQGAFDQLIKIADNHH